MTNRPIFIAVILSGIIVGLWHLNLAAQAIFVFTENEPLISWIVIALGPLTTLFASIAAISNRKVGGYWLACSGVVSFFLFIFSEPQTIEHAPPFLLQVSAPMVIIGVATIAAAE